MNIRGMKNKPHHQQFKMMSMSMMMAGDLDLNLYGGGGKLVIKRSVSLVASHPHQPNDITASDTGTITIELLQRTLERVRTEGLENIPGLALLADGEVDSSSLRMLVAVALAHDGEPEKISAWLQGREIKCHLTTEQVSKLLSSVLPKEKIEMWLAGEVGQRAFEDKKSIILLAHASRLYNLPENEKKEAIPKWIRLGDQLLELQAQLKQGQIMALIACHVASGVSDVKYLFDGLALLKHLATTGHDLSHPWPFVALMKSFSRLKAGRAGRFQACFRVRKLMIEAGARFHSAHHVVPLLRSCFHSDYPPETLLRGKFPSEFRSVSMHGKLTVIEKEMIFDGLAHSKRTTLLALALLCFNELDTKPFLMYWNEMHHRFPPSQTAYFLLFHALSRTPETARQAISTFLPRAQRDLPHFTKSLSPLIRTILIAAHRSEDMPSRLRTANFIIQDVGLDKVPEESLHLLARLDNTSDLLLEELLRRKAACDSDKSTWFLILQCYVETCRFEETTQLFLDYLARFHSHKKLEARTSFKNGLTYLQITYNFRLTNSPIPNDICYFVSKMIDCLVSQARVGHAEILFRQLLAANKPFLPFFTQSRLGPERFYYPIRSIVTLREAVKSHLSHHGLIDQLQVKPKPAIDMGTGPEVMNLVTTLDESIDVTMDPERFLFLAHKLAVII